MLNRYINIFILSFTLIYPVSFCYSSEKTTEQSYLSLILEAEKSLSNHDVLRAVYCAELLDNAFTSMSDESIRYRYIDMLNSVSMACYDEKMFAKALSLAYKGVDCSIESKYNAPLGELYKTVGNVMNNFGDYENGYKYYLKSLESARSENNSVLVAKTLSNLVVTTYLSGNIVEAHRFFDEMEALSQENKSEEEPIETYVRYYTRAAIQKIDQNYDSAFYYFQKASEIAKNKQLPMLYCTSCNYEIAVLYDSLNQIDSAKYYYAINLDIANNYNLPEERLYSYKALSCIAQKEGDMNKAFQYKESYLMLSDSLLNLSELRAIEQSRYEYKETSNKHEISRLSHVNDVKSSWIRLILIILISLIIVLLLIYRQKRILKTAYNNLYKFNSGLLNFESLCYEQSKKISTLTQQLESLSSEKNEEVSFKSMSTNMEKEVALCNASFQPTEDQKQKMIEAIEYYMRNVDIICNPDFSLEQLSVLTKYNYKYLSQIINETYHQNFRSFLSEYRIREAQRMLSNYDDYGNYTIQSIGERVGYRSQSTFISVFRKTTGLTPSQYLQLSLEDRKLSKQKD